MKVRRPLFASFLAAFFLLAMGPMPATNAPGGSQTIVQRGSFFDRNVNFKQAAVCDGSVRFEKGMYRVHVEATGMGDGSVRASFFDMHANDRKACEAHGIIKVLPSAGGTKIVPGAANDTVTPGPPNSQATLSSLGFNANSPVSFRSEGSQLKLVIGGQGQNQILISLLLPAVQLPAVQKVREAASRPAK